MQVTRKKVNIIKYLSKEVREIPQGRVSKDDIIELAGKINVVTKNTVGKGVIETTVDNPEEALQVAYERILLNLEKFHISAF